MLGILATTLKLIPMDNELVQSPEDLKWIDSHFRYFRDSPDHLDMEVCAQDVPNKK